LWPYFSYFNRKISKKKKTYHSLSHLHHHSSQVVCHISWLCQYKSFCYIEIRLASNLQNVRRKHTVKLINILQKSKCDFPKKTKKKILQIPVATEKYHNIFLGHDTRFRIKSIYLHNAKALTAIIRYKLWHHHPILVFYVK
jgi:hypothetical protein